MEWIDLRSDTVTQPTKEMRKAMANAEVGDDVYGEDPTVRLLEEISAEKLGKEAAIFLPSGTMGNLIALLTHCRRGDEVILGNKSHIFLDEAGGMAVLGGIHPYPLPNLRDGRVEMAAISGAIRPDDEHCPISRLICLENTHNYCGGSPIPLEYCREVGRLARKNHLLLHLDGARIFNAAVALGADPKQLSAPADSISFCLSKGLCAPAGSVLCGREDFIRQARRTRKLLGGGMRQIGILAAAGIIGLRSMTARLEEDHARARRLADALVGMPGVKMDYYPPATNMIFFRLTNRARVGSEELALELKKRGILIFPDARIRLVTHYWVDDSAIEGVIAAFNEILVK